MPAESANQLSIFLIARNEADRLARTLEAVAGLSDDIVLVDSGSTDGTPRIAEAYGARVIVNAWAGYGPQKRFAEEQCRHDWLLNIDADEVIPPDLAEEIRAVLQRPEADAYRIRIAEIFPSEKAPHPIAYALSPVRLYRKSKGRYSASTVHDRVDLAPDARVGRLKGIIHHFSVRSIGDQIAKLNAYSDQQVQDLENRGKKLGTWRIITEFPLAFLRAYIVRRHFVRGVYGIITAMNFAFYRWLRVAKDYERRMLDKARRDEK